MDGWMDGWMGWELRLYNRMTGWMEREAIVHRICLSVL